MQDAGARRVSNAEGIRRIVRKHDCALPAQYTKHSNARGHSLLLVYLLKALQCPHPLQTPERCETWLPPWPWGSDTTYPGAAHGSWGLRQARGLRGVLLFTAIRVSVVVMVTVMITVAVMASIRLRASTRVKASTRVILRPALRLRPALGVRPGFRRCSGTWRLVHAGYGRQ